MKLIDNSAKTNWIFVSIVTILGITGGVATLIYSTQNGSYTAPLVADYLSKDTKSAVFGFDIVVHPQPLDKFEYLNESGGFGFRYDARENAWKPIPPEAPQTLAPQKQQLGNLVFYSVPIGDAAITGKRVFLEGPQGDFVVELTLYRNESYRDCIAPCPEQKPFSDSKTIEQILSTFRFVETSEVPSSVNLYPITFLSPQEGETWKMGESHTIQLSQAPVDFVLDRNLVLIDSNGSKVGIIYCVKLGGDTDYQWNDTKTVLNYCGAGLKDKTTTIQPGQYKIRLTRGQISDSGSTGTLAESDYFTITND